MKTRFIAVLKDGRRQEYETAVEAVAAVIESGDGGAIEVITIRAYVITKEP